MKGEGGEQTLSVRSEAQTFELAPESFVIEIIGQLKITDGQPDGTTFIEMNGGFYLRIQPTRFELFALANATIGAANGSDGLISGSAAGLVVIDLRAGSIGVAASLSIEMQVGGNSLPALDGIFSFEGKARVMLNTTGIDQVFEIPESFLPPSSRKA